MVPVKVVPAIGIPTNGVPVNGVIVNEVPANGVTANVSEVTPRGKPKNQAALPEDAGLAVCQCPTPPTCIPEVANADGGTSSDAKPKTTVATAAAVRAAATGERADPSPSFQNMVVDSVAGVALHSAPPLAGSPVQVKEKHVGNGDHVPTPF